MVQATDKLASQSFDIQSEVGPPHVDRGFVAGLTLSNIGAAFAFAPLLSILMPLRAEQIDPAHKQLLLSDLLFWGALTAGASNVIWGALSDATRSRLGRRRPWMLAGLAGTLASYVVIARAADRGALLFGLVLFQLCFNALFAALAAIFPDRVPDRQKGVVAGWIGIGYPVGAGLGAVMIGRLIDGAPARYWLIAAILAATVTPFALTLQDRPPEPDGKPKPTRLLAVGLTYRDFALAWVARFMVQTAFFIASAYGLFYLEEVVRYPELFPGARPERGVATLIVVSTLANVLASLTLGRLSDRVGRRKIFIIGSAALVGVAMLAAAQGPSWAGVIGIWAMLGAGLGGFIAVESAMVAQVLPSQHHAGRDLGLMNLGNTLPQCVAPALAYFLLHGPHPDYRALFGVGGAIALVGALVIQPIRRVP